MNQILSSYWNTPGEFEVMATTDTTKGQTLSIEIVNETGRLESLAEEWEGLTARSSATVFQTFDWQSLWWKHFGGHADQHLFVVLFRADEKLVGIAPFFIHSYSLLHFTIFRRLMLLGSGPQCSPSPLLSLSRQGPSDHLDVIVAHGFEERIAKSLVALLCSESYLWDEVELQNIPGKGILSTYVIPLLEPQGYSVRMAEEDVCPFISLPKSMEEYYRSLRHSVRRNLRYVHRGYLEGAEYQIDDVVGRKNIEGGMQILTQLHQKRWNSIGYPGLFADPHFGPFLEEVASVLARKDRLWFKIVRKEGKAIAVNLILRLHQKLYTYISGLDREPGTGPTHSGAGSALIVLSIEDAIKSGIEVMDLGRGVESYKSQLTSVANRNWRITITSDHARSRTWRVLLFKLRSLWIDVASRATCEAFIFRVLAKEKGWARAFQAYGSHIWHRLTRKEENVFAEHQAASSPQPKIHKEHSASSAEARSASQQSRRKEPEQRDRVNEDGESDGRV